jgi:hypothetical protein
VVEKNRENKFSLQDIIILLDGAKNKVPTWEVLQKRDWNGLRICFISREQGECITHILVSCHFYLEVWYAKKTLITCMVVWMDSPYLNPLNHGSRIHR